MSGIIIGTAGHVDHGKTALIKALTGVDTDRLKEEKKRGITIELGFAQLTLSDGRVAGIVDVPGHEKFIANMLAGAGGIDLALLVVAADDGVMPQTREHLGILRLLGIKSGVVVITKADLVEQAWLDMVAEDIRELVGGTFLDGVPVQAVSAHTGQGIAELRALIEQMVDKSGGKSVGGTFRIPVDRVFSVDGFGTVITGTMIEGGVREGDEVEIYPSGVRTRVRGLQVHGKDVQTAGAGQRLAVNLASLKREELDRGDTLAAPGSMLNTMMLDAKIHILPDSGRVITNGTRLHFYHGSREMLCKLILLEADKLSPGEQGFAQLRFTGQLAAKKGDRFVLRFYSPLETVGGGIILDPNPKRHKRHSETVLSSLSVRESGGMAENILQAIADGSPALSPLCNTQRLLGLSGAEFSTAVAGLAKEGRILPLGDKAAIDAGYKQTLQDKLRQILSEYHTANPLLEGMRRDELRSRLLPGRDPGLADHVLTHFAESGVIALNGQKAALAGFKPKGSAGDNALAEKIEALFLHAGYAPPSPDEVYTLYPKEKIVAKKVLDALLARGVLVSVAPGMYFHHTVYADAMDKVTSFITREGQITLAQARDMSGSSRKFVLALLEHFDRHGITKKVGDARVLAKKA